MDLSTQIFPEFSTGRGGRSIKFFSRSVGALDVPFGSLDFSAPSHPLTESNMGFFGQFFLFFELVPRITPLPIGLGSCNLVCALSVMTLHMSFGGFNFIP